MTFNDLPTLRAVPTVTAAQMAEVDRITAQDLHIPVEILTFGVVRAVDVRRRGAPELLLDRLDPAHLAMSSFANSTVFSR